MPRGWLPVATGDAFGARAPLEPSTENWVMVPLGSWLVTYALAPSGLMAMPAGREPAATVAGCLGVNTPAAETSYCATAASSKFVTYALEPSGLTAICPAPAPVATFDARVSAPAPPTS
jgi:hypothetical protein